MLEVQKVLRNNPNPLEFLKNNYGVEHKFNNDKSLVILDYNQIECEKAGKKTHPVVCECRGLVLENNTWELVSRAFSRFFNIEEHSGEFDWSGPIECTTKHDGSLIKISNYNNSWLISTRFSFGEGEVNNSGFTWRDLVLAHIDLTKLNPSFTYVGELCGPYNRVVRNYPPSFFLLSVFNGEIEFDYWAWTYEANRIGCKFTESHEVKSKTQLLSLLDEIVKNEPDFEGLVAKDCHGNRVKVKHPNYIRLHHMVANGNIANPKYLVPILMSGERDEVLSYFKWLEPYANEYQAKIDGAWKEIDILWNKTKNIDNQKDFALSIKNSKYSSILFNSKKYNCCPSILFDLNFVLKFVF